MIAAGGTTRRRFAWRGFAIVLAIVVCLALAPVGAAFVADLLANAHGCALEDGQIHPCVIGGIDWGWMLYGLFMTRWLMLFTLPMGLLAFLTWLGALVFQLFAYWRKAPKEAS